MMFRADLHCHSFFSDGTNSPEELILLAKEIGLQGLSIADHDTIAAYSEAFFHAQKNQIFLLPGVEFSAVHRGESIHILAYAFCLTSERIIHLCERHKQRRKNRSSCILERLKGLGIDLKLNEISEQAKESWGRPHIAYALLKEGKVRSIQEAFDLYLGEGKPAYVPSGSATVEETLEIIQQGGGKAILAHPHLIKKGATVRALLAMPFDGLECYYARLHPHQEKKWIDLAQKKNWIITGGSDYHGTIKPYSALGASWVGEETFSLLYRHFLKTNNLLGLQP